MIKLWLTPSAFLKRIEQISEFWITVCFCSACSLAEGRILLLHFLLDHLNGRPPPSDISKIFWIDFFVVLLLMLFSYTYLLVKDLY